MKLFDDENYIKKKYDLPRPDKLTPDLERFPHKQLSLQILNFIKIETKNWLHISYYIIWFFLVLCYDEVFKRKKTI